MASNRIGLLAGEGELPLQIARSAKEQGLDLFAYTLDKRNFAELRQWVLPDRIRRIQPGLLEQNLRALRQDEIGWAVFAGKINKWTLLKSPLLDARALRLWREQQQFNDDSIMLTLIRELEREGISVASQADFLQGLFIRPALYTIRQPTEQERKDIEYGFSVAKEMGRLDIGQTVIISNQMAIAVEAIEGTDQAIIRSKKWIGRRGGVVVKVEKPSQDRRFDIPTVGPRTLRTMRKAGLKVLALEAGKTLALELEIMIRLANRWDMSLVAL